MAFPIAPSRGRQDLLQQRQTLSAQIRFLMLAPSPSREQLEQVVTDLERFVSVHGPDEALRNALRATLVSIHPKLGLDETGRWAFQEKDLDEFEVAKIFPSLSEAGLPDRLESLLALLRAGSGLTVSKARAASQFLAEQEELPPFETLQPFVEALERVLKQAVRDHATLRRTPKIAFELASNLLSLEYLQMVREMSGAARTRPDASKLGFDVARMALPEPGASHAWKVFADNLNALGKPLGPANPGGLTALGLRALEAQGKLTAPLIKQIAVEVSADGRVSEEEAEALRNLADMPATEAAKRGLKMLQEGPQSPLDLPSEPAGASGVHGFFAWAKEHDAWFEDEGLLHVEPAQLEVREDHIDHRFFTVHGRTNGPTNPAEAPERSPSVSFGCFLVSLRLAQVFQMLTSIGLDLDSILPEKLHVYPHAINDKNAFADTQGSALVFGLAEGLAPVANQSDVILHELGHYLWEKLNPGMLFSMEGSALHEGYSDLLAVLFHGDPQLTAEGFGLLRHLGQVSSTRFDTQQPHDRGTLDGALGWAAHQVLSDAFPASEVRVILLEGLISAVGSLTTKSPSLYDRFLALAKALKYAVDRRGAPETATRMVRAMTKEADRLGFLDQATANSGQRSAQSSAAALRGFHRDISIDTIEGVLNEYLGTSDKLSLIYAIQGRPVGLPNGKKKVFLQAQPNWEGEVGRSNLWASAVFSRHGTLESISPGWQVTPLEVPERPRAEPATFDWLRDQLELEVATSTSRAVRQAARYGLRLLKQGDVEMKPRPFLYKVGEAVALAMAFSVGPLTYYYDPDVEGGSARWVRVPLAAEEVGDLPAETDQAELPSKRQARA